MDGFANYENLLGQSTQNDMYSNAMKGSVKETLQARLQAKKDKILATTEGIAMPLIVEGGRGVLSSAFKSVKKKVIDEGTQGAKEAVKEAGAMGEDFDKGGVKGVLKGTAKRLKQRIKDKADAELKKRGQENLGDDDEAEGTLSKIGKAIKGKVQDKIGNFMKGKPQLDDDIVSDLTKGGKTPSLGDYKDAVKKQLSRNSNDAGDAGDAGDGAGGAEESLADKLTKLKSLGSDANAGAGAGAEAGAGAGAEEDIGKGIKDATKLGDDLAKDGTIKVKTFAQQIKNASKVKQKLSQSVKADKYAQQKEDFRSLSKGTQEQYKTEYNTIKKAQQGRINPNDPLTDDNLDLHDSLLDKYTKQEQQQKQMNQQQQPKTGDDDDLQQPSQQQPPKTGDDDDLQQPEPPKPKTGDDDEPPKPNVGEGDEEGKTLGKKLGKTGEEMGEEELEGGGPEDPFADLISLGTGLVGLLGGLFGDKKKEAPVVQPTIQNVSTQIGQG